MRPTSLYALSPVSSFARTPSLPDPVVALDTFVYERKGIEVWFRICRNSGRPLTSPKTQEVIGRTLISNSTNKILVNDFIDQKMKEWADLSPSVT